MRDAYSLRLETKDGRVYEVTSPYLGATHEVSVDYKTYHKTHAFRRAIFDAVGFDGTNYVYRQRPGKGQPRLTFVPKHWVRVK